MHEHEALKNWRELFLGPVNSSIPAHNARERLTILSVFQGFEIAVCDCHLKAEKLDWLEIFGNLKKLWQIAQTNN